MLTEFTNLLMHWHQFTNQREMPWKGEKDPYKIWLSEIILQQTRVEQGWAYYEKFIKNYPTIHYLAAANDADVFKLWEGLGYYNRCKNLLFTARQIVQQMNGQFPEEYDQIMQLKGIGPYTAAAIASFAFNLPHAVVDGNVFRVLARVFGIATPTDSTKGKLQFTTLANNVLYQQQAGLYNQAIMDFGATVCKPFGALCATCLLQNICIAYNNGQVNYLPVKEKVLLKKRRWFYYFIFQCNDATLVHKRAGNDIWQSLYEFYLVENAEQLSWDTAQVTQWLQQQLNISEAAITHISAQMAQQLTHQQIKGQFINVTLTQIPETLQHYQWHPKSQLIQLPFPKFINQYLELKAIQSMLL